MHNFTRITERANKFRKAVLYDKFDEPTYLTFALDFQFEELTQTQIGDSLLWKSYLFSEDRDGAISYLSNRGYNAYSNSLKTFKNILYFLTWNAPWYFQSLSGLSALWKASTDISKPKGENAVITVGTYEAIDLRMTQLANLYRTAIFDKIYMRERVPDNLRWFSMDIWIAEARNMSSPTGGVNVGAIIPGQAGAITNQVLNTANTITTPQSSLLEDYSYVKFRCRQCEFDFSDSIIGSSQTITSDIAREPSVGQFKINIGYFEEESKYVNGTQIYDSSIRTKVRDNWRELGDQAKSNTGSGIGQIGSSAIGALGAAFQGL
jgi:hypothetical protein